MQAQAEYEAKSPAAKAPKKPSPPSRNARHRGSGSPGGTRRRCADGAGVPVSLVFSPDAFESQNGGSATFRASRP